MVLNGSFRISKRDLREERREIGEKEGRSSNVIRGNLRTSQERERGLVWDGVGWGQSILKAWKCLTEWESERGRDVTWPFPHKNESVNRGGEVMGWGGARRGKSPYELWGILSWEGGGRYRHLYQRHYCQLKEKGTPSRAMDTFRTYKHTIRFAPLND